MQFRHIRWSLILVPALLVGGFEFFRHRFFDGLPTAFGNLAAAALAVGGSLLYYLYTFRVIERLTAALRRDERQTALAEERERIAGRLHDSMAQSLFFLNAQLDRVAGALQEEELAAAHNLLDDAREGVRFADHDLRQMIGALKRSNWDEPLAPALQDAVAAFRRQSGLDVKVEIPPEGVPSLPRRARYQVLRLVREALTNVRKHAAAQSVRVEISEISESSREGGLAVSVVDDGKGFDPATVHQGFGLQEMEEIASQLGGELTFHRPETGGTAVQLHVPDTDRLFGG